MGQVGVTLFARENEGILYNEGFLLAVLVSLIGLLCWHVISSFRRDQKERILAAERARKQHADEQKRIHDEQKRIHRGLSQLVSDIHADVELLTTNISNAEASLDLAEEEFKEGAYLPFWDAVEKAVRSLAAYDGGLSAINSKSLQIPAEIKKLDSPPQIDMSKFVGPDADQAIKRMNQIVRQAQKDKDFTTIFLQIRTNQILGAGFANLGSAIEDMADRVQLSICTLSHTLDSGMSAIRDQQSAIAEAQRDRDEAQRERDDTQTEMLNNIQRRRVPLPKEYRDGQY